MILQLLVILVKIRVNFQYISLFLFIYFCIIVIRISDERFVLKCYENFSKSIKKHLQP